MKSIMKKDKKLYMIMCMNL